MSKSYKDLDVYKISLDLFIKTHKFSFKMPKYETYELGSQIRRSADSVNSNIVEGYGRKVYKNDFVRFLIYSHSSNDETKNHLLKIKKLYPHLAQEAEELEDEYHNLGGKIHRIRSKQLENINLRKPASQRESGNRHKKSKGMK